MFTHLEEGYLLSESREDAEIGNESDEDLTMPQIISEEEIDSMSSGNESDDEPMYTEML